MKKILLSVLVVFAMVGAANATLFSIGNGGSLSFDGVNFGTGGYTANALTSNFDLSVGQESGNIDFFKVIFNALAIGAGTVNASIELVAPASNDLDDSGSYKGLALGRFVLGEIKWGAPVELGYGNGGVLLLDLYDQKIAGCGFTISGDITNLRDPAPVPEPATMLLLGCGLIGLAGYGRKKFKK